MQCRRRYRSASHRIDMLCNEMNILVVSLYLISLNRLSLTGDILVHITAVI